MLGGVFDERRLAGDLAVCVRGEVRFWKGTRALFADGLSRREQIRQQTDRRALHLAQVPHEGRAGGVELA